MRTTFSLLILFCLQLSFFRIHAQDREKFSAAEIKADLDYLYETLQSSHYNLFVNTPKKKFDRIFLELKNSISDSLNSLQINRLFQPFVALSKLGHCVTGYPFKSYNAFMAGGGKVFPFDVRVQQGRVYITGNYSEDTTIQKGDEILAFYGVNAKQWLGKIYNYLSGENEEFKNTFIDLIGFPRLYWMVYDDSKMFSIKIKRRSGEIVYVNDAGINASDYKKIFDSRPPLFNSSRSFRFIGEIAYLHPGIFLNQESSQGISDRKAFEKGEFLFFIDSSFQQIKQRSSKNLIIDLRGNPGGANTFSDAMVAFFADKPFSFCSAFYVKTSSITKEFWKDVNDQSLLDLKEKILTKKDGETFENEIKKHVPRTDSLRFDGQVYVLIDRYSYSNAATTAAMIQDYKFGKLIGEQTAESPTLYAAAHEFKLPHTKIGVTYPKALIVRPNGDKSLKGVQPDIQVLDDYLTSTDEILEYTLNIINDTKTMSTTSKNKPVNK